VAKYADGLPLYRQSAIYAREGIDLERSTLADWVGRMAALLDPLVQAIGRHVCAGSVLHADDTTVEVLAPGQGRTRIGRLWAAMRDERALVEQRRRLRSTPVRAHWPLRHVRPNECRAEAPPERGCWHIATSQV
jgi:Transposase IS66 family